MDPLVDNDSVTDAVHELRFVTGCESEEQIRGNCFRGKRQWGPNFLTNGRGINFQRGSGAGSVHSSRYMGDVHFVQCMRLIHRKIRLSSLSKHYALDQNFVCHSS